MRIDRDTLEARVKVIGCELWSDEEGFQEATAATGICGSGIIEALAEMYLAGILLTDGTIAGAARARSERIVEEGRTFRYVLHPGEPAISIHQNDVRAIQLAKAALMAGARLLMDRFEIATVDRIVLTGAFGSHIDPLYAMVLGMIPDCPLDKVSAAGNAAGTGALIALLDCAAREEIEAIVREIEKVETAVEPAFQRHFVDAMAIPPRHGGLRPPAPARHAAHRGGSTGPVRPPPQSPPQPVLAQAKASGMDAFFFAMNSLSASSTPGSMGGCLVGGQHRLEEVVRPLRRVLGAVRLPLLEARVVGDGGSGRRRSRSSPGCERSRDSGCPARPRGSHQAPDR